MKRVTIGYFKMGDQKHLYNIYFTEGLSNMEIGNSTFGTFLYFDDDGFVHLKGEGGWYKSQGWVKLWFPEYSNDIERMLKMVFKVRGLKLVSLNTKSRKELRRIHTLHCI